MTLFNTSVMGNIRLGRRNAADDEIIAAAKLANCHQFIEGMEEGLPNYAGRKRRKTLRWREPAHIHCPRLYQERAHPHIGEIAASLDVENKSQIQESLNQLIQNKTVLIISHRLKSIRNVDHIVVLKEGRVEAQGKHDLLMQRSPAYQNLVQNAKLAEEFI